MKSPIERPETDWAGNIRSFVPAWGLPTGAIVFGVFLGSQPRALVWSLALVWMGTACLLNYRRCGRTRCRYTGPFYLVLVIPVLLHGFDVIPLGDGGWWMLGLTILIGGKVVWLGTESIWGTYSGR